MESEEIAAVREQKARQATGGEAGSRRRRQRTGKLGNLSL